MVTATPIINIGDLAPLKEVRDVPRLAAAKAINPNKSDIAVHYEGLGLRTNILSKLPQSLRWGLENRVFKQTNKQVHYKPLPHPLIIFTQLCKL